MARALDRGPLTVASRSRKPLPFRAAGAFFYGVSGNGLPLASGRNGAATTPRMKNSASCLPERRHHLSREPAELLDELVRRQPLGPMDHEVFEPGILRFDRLDPVDHLGRRAAEPGLLLDPLGEGR